MVAWVGYPQVCVRYERQARVAGATKYPLRKMIGLAWTAAVSFSPLPLRASFFAAGAMMLLAIEEAVRAFVEHLSGHTVPGWTSLMIVLCLSNGALLMTVGVLGEYVAKIFEEGKGRPLYIVADTWNVVQKPERTTLDRP
jgi:dolichol-phosphate mannosyltransferase